MSIHRKRVATGSVKRTLFKGKAQPYYRTREPINPEWAERNRPLTMGEQAEREMLRRQHLVHKFY